MNERPEPPMRAVVAHRLRVPRSGEKMAPARIMILECGHQIISIKRDYPPVPRPCHQCLVESMKPYRRAIGP